jgi:sugar lactone lactonase YvrE
VLSRQSDGSLTQASDGSGCVTTVPVEGCTTGRQLAGANAVALSPNNKNLYATALFSNAVSTFGRVSTGVIGQTPGIAGCTVDQGAQNCRFGRKMSQPEGLVVSPDGRNVYVTAFGSNAIDVMRRNTSNGSLKQAPRTDTCVAAKTGSDCTKGRALGGVSSIVVSPDGKFVYATAFKSGAVVAFKRK